MYTLRRPVMLGVSAIRISASMPLALSVGTNARLRDPGSRSWS